MIRKYYIPHYTWFHFWLLDLVEEELIELCLVRVNVFQRMLKEKRKMTISKEHCLYANILPVLLQIFLL